LVFPAALSDQSTHSHLPCLLLLLLLLLLLRPLPLHSLLLHPPQQRHDMA
jgi:hypothetical protein